MTAIVVSTDTTVSAPLNTGDTLHITETGSIKTVDSVAIFAGLGGPVANSAQIRIDGTVLAENASALMVGGTGNTLQIGATGSLTSGNSRASIGDVGVVINAGTISSYNIAYAAISANVSLNLFNTGSITNLRLDAPSTTYAILGGTGSDYIHNMGSISGKVSLGDGDDIYDGRGGAVSGIVDLGSGNNRAYGGSSSETFWAGTGNDIIDGGDGIDTISFESGTLHTITIDLSLTGPQNMGLFGTDIYLNIENVIGTYGDDKITGNSGANRLQGEDGNDILNGGAGNDTLDGGGDDDVLNGGDGFDTVVFNPFYGGGVYANMADPTDTWNTLGKDTYISIELLSGTQVGDTFIGNAAANGFQGNGGNDTLDGGAGSDTVYYTGAVNVNLATGVAVSSTEGTDTLRNIENVSGSTDSDILTGNAFANSLFGKDGNDKLSGGGGNDVLVGGAGKDIFVFNTAPNKTSNVDKITDFSVKDDTIQLENAIFKKLGSKTGTLNKAYFAFGAAAKDSNDYVLYDTKTGYLRYDADGVGKGASVIIAKLPVNLKTMSYADFVVI